MLPDAQNPVTKADLLEILTERDVHNTGQLREIFQADLKSTLQEIENKSLKREQKYADTLHETNIILERLTNSMEQVFERTKRLLDITDDLKETQYQQKGAAKVWFAIVGTVGAIGSVAGLMALLK